MSWLTQKDTCREDTKINFKIIKDCIISYNIITADKDFLKRLESTEAMTSQKTFFAF